MKCVLTPAKKKCLCAQMNCCKDMAVQQVIQHRCYRCCSHNRTPILLATSLGTFVLARMCAAASVHSLTGLLLVSCVAQGWHSWLGHSRLSSRFWQHQAGCYIDTLIHSAPVCRLKPLAFFLRSSSISCAASMAKFELSLQLPEEAAIWVMEHGSGLEVKPHPVKAHAWCVIQVPGMYICHLSYNKKGNLYFFGAPHIIRAIENLHNEYYAAGRRGFFFDPPDKKQTRCTD